MSEFLGVGSWLSIFDNPKRDALIFDKIAIPFLSGFLNALQTSKQKIPKTLSAFPFPFIERAEEIQWLLDSGLLFEPQLRFDEARLNSNIEFQKHGYAANQKFVDLMTYFEAGGAKLFGKSVRGLLKGRIASVEDLDGTVIDFFEDILKFTEHVTRLTAIQFRELHNIEAYPIMKYDTPLDFDSTDSKTHVVQIVLGSLPIPKDDTPWEQIVEYRSDPDSRDKFLDLRNWMSEVARAQLSGNEVQEKLEWLLSRYQRHIQLHNMKTNAGTLEIVLTTAAEFVEDLAHLKFGAATKVLFSLKQRRIALMEGELTSPGSEVAYVVKSRESFS